MPHEPAADHGGLLALPHQKVDQFQAVSGNGTVTLADFGHLPTRCRFVAFILQWDFLDFLAGHASAFSGFTLRMESQVTDLLEEKGTIVGVRAERGNGPVEVRATWQCVYVVPKGGAEQVKRRGLEAFQADVAVSSPSSVTAKEEISSWDDVALLSVRIDRLTRWYRPGLMCIGDAAHAMSPVGGVGINFAIQG